VGDIKPAEYLTQYFLDAAFDADVLKQDPARHLEDWAAAQFGPANARETAAILREYYRLAWERRPEFMGWSQTEPTRPVRSTAYVRTGGDEAERRLADYRALTARAESLGARIPAPLRDAWFELVRGAPGGGHAYACGARARPGRGAGPDRRRAGRRARPLRDAAHRLNDAWNFRQDFRKIAHGTVPVQHLESSSWGTQGVALR
jgi:hypothetical protein